MQEKWEWWWLYVTEIVNNVPKFMPSSMRRIKTLRSDMPLNSTSKTQHPISSPNENEAELLRQFDKVKHFYVIIMTSHTSKCYC